MKKKVILGLVVVLGIAGIASIVMSNESFTMKKTQKQTKLVPIHHKETFETLLAIKQGKSCTDDLGTSKLAPGQTVEDKWIFIPKQWIKNELEQANAGTYDVKVYLPQESSVFSREEARKLATKIPIIVHGTAE